MMHPICYCNATSVRWDCPPFIIVIGHIAAAFLGLQENVGNHGFLCKKSHLINKIITFLLLNILKQRDDAVFSALVDNLWSAYSEKGSILEKKNQASVAGSEETKMGGLPYVFTDIMTYFTMLVGIYFPSVTGRYNYFS